MNGIIYHRKDEATNISNGNIYIVTRRGQSNMIRTTRGWSLLIQWKYETESWVPLKYLKESHPVEAAEYAKYFGIADETAFA